MKEFLTEAELLALGVEAQLQYTRLTANAGPALMYSRYFRNDVVEAKLQKLFSFYLIDTVVASRCFDAVKMTDHDGLEHLAFTSSKRVYRRGPDGVFTFIEEIDIEDAMGTRLDPKKMLTAAIDELNSRHENDEEAILEDLLSTPLTRRGTLQ